MLLKKSTMSGIMETGGAGMSGCPCELIFASERGVNSMYNDMMDTIGLVEKADPELAAAMDRELARQRENIELIASENIVSPAVMAAMGSILTNKYAEGLPGKRYYGGCAYVDEVENIAIQRACKLFGAKYANVQPHSGAQANLAVYFALLDLGDTVMGMDLSQGGHLTHGSPVNMSGKNYHFVSYGVGEDGRIDYAELEKQVRKVRPKMIVAGASAYPRAIDFEKLAEIAHGYGAFLMVDMAHIAGLVAGGMHQSPVPYADVVTTTTHKTLRGPRGGLILTNNAVLAKRINSAVFPGTQGGPLEHVIAAKAVCFGEALKPEFKDYARKIVENAQAMAAELQARGVKLVSGGTDNHLMLLDLRDEECTGKELEARLDSVHITANKNTVPGETRSPFVTSGVRLGTPAVTTRGMGEAEMKVIADCIADCIWHYDEKKDPEPECSLALVLYQIDPSSLGFGMNIHDKMTLSTYFTGPVSHPIGTGKVEMDELHIPGLDFANVEGNVYYENSLLQFTDVTADVYKGKLAAYGDYDLDTRFYNLYGHGSELQTESALPKSGLHTRVDLDLEIHSEGSAKSTVSSGSFLSGPGRYHLLPFDSLSGKVTDAGGDLYFYDAVIKLPGFTISTDAFHI